jgi:hypothetical protein
MIAGVQLLNGTRLWVEAGEHRPRPLDRVTVLVEGETHEATVFAAPGQLSATKLDPTGAIASVRLPHRGPQTRAVLPGVGMPPLGSQVRWQGRLVMVKAIDPITEAVTVDVSGNSFVVPVHDVVKE